MQNASRFYANGAPATCKECGNKFDGHAWRTSSGYFCSEWCADAYDGRQTPEERGRALQ